MMKPQSTDQQDAAVDGEHTVAERILIAGERLFAEHGYAAVGVRAITNAAGVNLGALHYYFGSKERLIEAIFERRLRPVAAARLRLLEQCQEDLEAPVLERLIESFLRAGLVDGWSSSEDRMIYSKLRARFPFESEKVAGRILREAFNDSTPKYIEAIGRTLPELPQEEVYWRFHFLLAVHLCTLTNNTRIYELSGGACDPRRVDEAIQHMIPFIAAGFRSPSVGNPHAIR